MKRLLINLFSMGLLLTGSVLQVSCQNKSKNSKEAVSNQEDVSYIKEIDAAFMKEHIFDYEKNPTQFVYKGNKPAVIDFYANWCGPCRQLAPKLERVINSYNGEIILYKVNVDNNRELAARFAVESIPMVLFIPIGDTPYQTMGNLPEATIKEYIEKILPKKN